MAQGFALRIELGNAAMERPAEVAWALREVAVRLEQMDDFTDINDSSGSVRDENGNTVGEWEVEAI